MYIIKHRELNIFKKGRFGWTDNPDKARVFTRRPLAYIRSYNRLNRYNEPIISIQDDFLRIIAGVPVDMRHFEIKKVILNWTNDDYRL